MTDRDGDPPDELADRLDDLEDALSELRAELDGEGRDPGIPRSPRPSELLRFTERYTIPTVIALLEATIRSLELLRGALRLADPGRDLGGDDRPASSDRLDAVRGEASDRLAGSLRELRRALSAADLPSEPEARSIIEEARDLSAEIERRLDDDAAPGSAGREGTAGNDGTDAADDPVRIDVTGADDADGDDAGADDADPDGDDVDVEAELRTLKRQYGDDGAEPDADADPDATPDGEDDGTDADSAAPGGAGDDGTDAADDDPGDGDG